MRRRRSVVFGERRKETSWAHQIASAAILTSPLLVYGAHPASLLANPAVDVIRSIPSVWDETRVLPASRIGELALFARRRGTTWFVAAMNGPAARTVNVDLAFLGKGPYRAVVVKDKADDPAAVELETRSLSAQDTLEIAMRPAGGFVARLGGSGPTSERGAAAGGGARRGVSGGELTALAVVGECPPEIKARRSDGRPGQQT